MLRIKLGGATYLATTSALGDAAVIRSMEVSTIWDLAAGNYVELIALQNSGGALNVDPAEFMMVKV